MNTMQKENRKAEARNPSLSMSPRRETSGSSLRPRPRQRLHGHRLLPGECYPEAKDFSSASDPVRHLRQIPGKPVQNRQEAGTNRIIFSLSSPPLRPFIIDKRKRLFYSMQISLPVKLILSLPISLSLYLSFLQSAIPNSQSEIVLIFALPPYLPGVIGCPV